MRQDVAAAGACLGVRACVRAAILKFFALLLTPPPLCSLAQLLVTARGILNIVSGQKVRAHLQRCGADGRRAACRARAAPSAACARRRGEANLRCRAHALESTATGSGRHRGGVA